MKIKYDINAGPSRPEVLELRRKSQERLFPILAVVLASCFLFGAAAYLQLWSPDWNFAIEFGLGSVGIFAVILAWKLGEVILSLTHLSEAHPVTARAYLECASNEAVKSYCANVLEQNRNLTMAEADMLLKHCTTEEEIARLAAFYEEHAPLPEYKGIFSSDRRDSAVSFESSARKKHPVQS